MVGKITALTLLSKLLTVHKITENREIVRHLPTLDTESITLWIFNSENIHRLEPTNLWNQRRARYL